MRPHPALLLLLFGILACRPEGPRLDDNGCWEDGAEAFEAYATSICDQHMTCGEEYASHEDCMAELRARSVDASYSTSLCFDSCAVDPCLAEIAATLEACELTVLPSCLELFHFPNEGGSTECAQLGW